LTGNVTGNVTGNLTGNVTGDLTGNVTGNVTASSGTTTLNNLVVNGTADFTNTKLTNVVTPTAGTDAANKSYVDDTVAAVIDAAPAALDTLNELAAALGDDANFSSTVTTALATKLPLAGGTMTGAIAMGTSKITGLGDPTSAQDAATKTYVDTADALKLNLTGGTMSGAIAMGTNKITGVGDPTLAQDAATKAYTDSILGSATSAADSAAAASASASAASTSASNASDSEDAAAASAAAAASSYDAFDDRYLGDKASDPTLDNDGNALLTGALYFNTTSDVMKVYDGSAWNIAAISSASPTFTGTVTADGLSLGDNDKATFGNSNDLEIFHDGSNSIVADVGTGGLFLSGSSYVAILNGDRSEYMLNGNVNGEVALYYDGSKKLATTSTGIDVTGTATMDGLTVDGNINANNFIFSDNGEILAGQDASGFYYASGVGTDNTLPIVIGDNNASIRLRTGNAVNRLQVAGNGDISFYEDTGTTPKFFWDASAERLGIGTTSPAVDLHISNSVVPRLRLEDSGSGQYAEIFTSNDDLVIGSDEGNTGGSSSIAFRVDSTERMRIDSSGNVGIGTSSPDEKLVVEGDIKLRGASYVHFTNTSDTISVGAASSVILRINSNAASGRIEFQTNGAEAMRIDSSGNLLVGKTSNGSSIVGFEIDQTGNCVITRDGGQSLLLNRLTSDGDIVLFRKDGTTVGRIGAKSGDIYIGTGDTGIRFNDTDNAVYAADTTTGSASDGNISLGVSLARFKDLYLSGGVYLGGTGAANKLDDYETGTFTPVIAGLTTTGTGTYTTQQGAYTKVGNLVTVTCHLNWTAHTGTGLMLITGLPFTMNSLVDIFSGSVYANNINAGTSATQLIAYVGGGTQISFRGFINNATRAETLVNTSGQLSVTISYRVA
jgi:hypothetical protein